MYDDIIQNFNRVFAHIKDERIALYGTGEISKLLLNSNLDFNFVCVLDSNCKEKEFCGKPVISIDQVNKYNITSIIVIARKSSAIIIRNQIRNICQVLNIDLFDLHGSNFCSVTKRCSVAEVLKHSGNSADSVVTDAFSKAYSDWAVNHTARQFSYTFVAPTITSFCWSLYTHIDKNEYDYVWFLSRDGYLIKKCLELLKSHFNVRAELIYLLISRNILNDENSYKNYLAYLSKQNIDGKKILIVDFAATGTCQEKLELLLNRCFDGFYFIHILKEGKARPNVKSYYSTLEYGNDTTTMYEVYLLLELIVSSTAPSLASFNANGEPIFCDYSVGSNIAEDIAQAQSGVLDYFYEHFDQFIKYNALPDLNLCDNILQIGIYEDLEEILFLNYEYLDDYYLRKYYLPLPCNQAH